MNFAAPRITASAAIPTRQVKVCSSFNVRQPRIGSMTVHQQSAMAAAPAIRPRLVATRFQAATGNGTAASYTPRTVPSDEALAIWKKADCVCFDVDCTVTVNDSLDLLAEFVGCGAEVEELTNKAMDGSMNLAKSLEIRLDILNCTPSDIRSFIKAHPPTSRLSPNIETLMKALQARGVDVYLISGGFREIILPVAAHLDVPADNIFANRMNWQWCDEVGEPAKLVGFDNSEPTSRNMGKVAAIKQIRENNTYNNVVMIGDGITDLEAVQATGGADLFIGYGGIVERPDVARQAEWFVYDHIELVEAFKKAPTAADAARIAGLPHPPKQGKPAKDDEDELGIPLRKPANKPVMAAVSPL